MVEPRASTIHLFIPLRSTGRPMLRHHIPDVNKQGSVSREGTNSSLKFPFFNGVFKRGLSPLS
jgi:hypothetical protein